MADDRGFFFACYGCGFVFPRDLKSYVKVKKVDSLRCPLCKFDIPKVVDHLCDTGYMCPSCSNILEYTDYPHHGTMKVKLHTTTDYFHGICPNCKTDDEGWGKRNLGEKIWVEEGGRVVLPLVCNSCGYRDVVKIGTYNHKRPEILLDWP